MKIILLCVLSFCVGLFSGVMLGPHKVKQGTRQYNRHSKKRRKKINLNREITTAPNLTKEQAEEWERKRLTSH